MRWNWVLSIVGLCLLATAAYVVLQTYLDPRKRLTSASCTDWLADPAEGYVTLTNCRLQVDDVLIQSTEGDFELLDKRVHGISSKLYPSPPTWAEAWAPVQSIFRPSPTARAVMKITSGDLMKWINTLDRAPDDRREAMWSTPTLLGRLALPAIIEARAVRTQTDFTAKFGGSVSVNTFELVPAVPEPVEAPVEGILVGVLGLTMLGASLRNTLRSRSAAVAAGVAVISTSDVKLEMGALEALKREEDSDEE